MKKLAALLALSALLTLSLAGCTDSAETPDNAAGDAVGSGETTTEQKQEEHSVDYDAMDEEEAKIRRIADAALTEKYGVSNFFDYKIDVELTPREEYSIEYDLEIQGYRTWESFRVYMSLDYEVTDIHDINLGEYSCYLDDATEAAVKQAERKLDEQVKGYNEHSGYYLGIDKEGYLCLYDEIIVDLDPPIVDEEGYVIEDHEHLFFSERICPKP